MPLHERDERDAERHTAADVQERAAWTTPQISSAALAANATKRKFAKRLNCAVHALRLGAERRERGRGTPPRGPSTSLGMREDCTQARPIG